MTQREPRVLYKYLDSRFASGMLERGTVRIGTLFDFRKKEKHGPRADVDENTLTRREHVPYLDLKSDNPDRAFARSFFRGPVDRALIAGNTFEE